MSEDSSERENKILDPEEISMISSCIPRNKSQVYREILVPQPFLPKKRSILREIFYSDFYEKFDIKYLTSEEDKNLYDISKI